MKKEVSGLIPTLFVKVNYFKELEEKIREYLEPVIRVEGCELIEFQLLPQRRKLILRFLIDKPGGITMGECVEVNKKLSRILDKAEFIEQSYILEVSSPGIDRPLREEKEFRCLIGKELIVKIKQGEEIRGDLLEVRPDKLLLVSEEKVLEIPISEIEKATQVVKLG